MKNTLLIVIVLFAISCEDILTEEPGAIVQETFYNTPEEVTTAVNAIYAPIKVYNCLGFLYPSQLESYSDFAHGRGSYSVLSNYQGLDNTNITRVGLIWNNLYLGIRNANLVIGSVPKSTQMSESEKNKFIAEAKFLRAFAYFQIVRNWGKAVLSTELNISEQDVPLSNEQDVYNFIVADLLFAEQHLSDNPAIAGRPSKWSAKTLLADVYFYRKLYAEAKNKASEVIESKKYSLVEVGKVEDFQKIFGADVISSPEEIFYLKFSRETGYVWDYVEFLHHPSDTYLNGKGLYALYLDTAKYTVYGKWNKNDLRKRLWFPWKIGLGNHTVLSLKFIDPKSVSGAGNDYPLYRYADLLLLYAEAACIVNKGPNADVVEKLNMVHRRGYGRNSLQPSEFDFKLSDFSGQESFLDAVLLERGYETQLEGGKRWLDLKRSGKVKEIIKAGTGMDVADKHLLWPVPEAEMNINKAIDPKSDQNPGY